MSNIGKAKWTKVAELLKSEEKGSLYLKFKEGCTISAGDALQLQDPRTNIKTLMAKGIVDEEKGNARLEKLATQSWYKYDVFQIK